MPNIFGWGNDEPQILPKEQGGDTIAVFASKIKNLFQNLFNTLNSYPWSNATQSTAGYMSAEDKAKLDGVDAKYLPLDGGTMTGDVRYVSPVTRGASSAKIVERCFFDNVDVNGARLAVGETVIYPDKSSRIALYAYDTTIPSGPFIGRLGIGCDLNGNVFTEAPTPPTLDVSKMIATTGFVENRLNYIESKSLTATDAVSENFSACAVQGHVCYISLSFGLAATPTNWSSITVFKSPVLPKFSINGSINNQRGTIGGLFLEILSNGDVNLHFTNGELPTDNYYHGILVFPC
ncbi:MAG: hypothetical protein J5974_06460 [Pyramidobacter sp.]|nr:hypothetical protein [Pyramidobacter sp.]